MPARIIFHEGYAPAFVGSGDNCRRVLRTLPRLIESIENLLKTVTIDTDHVPAKRGKLLIYRLYCHYVVIFTVDLQPIPGHDRHQIVQLIMGGRHGGFPDDSLLQFSVT